MKHFIKTDDKQTIEQLKNQGFQLIDEKNGMATFLNDASKSVFFDKTKISFSNVLTM